MKLHYFLNISNPTSAIFKKINLYTDRASGTGFVVNPNTKPVTIGSTPHTSMGRDIGCEEVMKTRRRNEPAGDSSFVGMTIERVGMAKSWDMFGC